MLDSIVLYAGLIILLIGLLALLSARRRRRGALLVGAGMIVMIIVLVLPAHETRSATRESRLDDVMPVWQFRERHATHVAALTGARFRGDPKCPRGRHRALQDAHHHPLPWSLHGRKHFESVAEDSDSRCCNAEWIPLSRRRSAA